MNAGGGETQACRLFLRLPASLDWRARMERLSLALEADSVACVLLPDVGPQELSPARDLVAAIRGAGAAALVRDDPDLLDRIGADGLHLDDPGKCQALRRRLGADATLGAACPLERHAAMLAGEAGADYVAFAVTAEVESHARDILSWWREMMVLPSVALIDDDTVAIASFKPICDFYSPPC